MWPTNPKTNWVSGALPIDQCVFDDVRFADIGFAGLTGVTSSWSR